LYYFQCRIVTIIASPYIDMLLLI